MLKNFKNYRIGKKLFITFGIIIFLLLLVVGIAIFSLVSNGDKFASFHDNGYQITNQVMEVRRAIQSSAKNIGYSMMVTSKEDTAAYIENAKSETSVMSDGVEYLREHFRGDQALVEAFNNSMTGIRDARNQVYELALNNQNDEASALYFSDVLPGYLAAQESLTKIFEVASQNADTNYNNSKTAETFSTFLLVAIAVLAFLATIYLGVYITKSLTAPIQELEHAAREMTQGHLKQEIAYESADELGSLAESMRVTMSTMSKIVSDVGYLLNEMAGGNFRIKTTAEDAYVGDFSPILLSMRDINTRLSDVLRQINEASNQVALGSTQMAESAQTLAEGATDQAGSVEELQATIENVAEHARTSAQDSKASFEKAHTVEIEAEQSSEKMRNLTEAMKKITETSNQIGAIIADIEDIATQTNLLSLNAAIEAARAGEAGKGFAVVADQIRKLAADSAESAVNTRKLIETSLNEVQNGSRLTQETAVALENVISGLQEIAGQVEHTRNSSEDQAASTVQIKEGIEQIAEVVQNNSATAEETSATSEELSAQAVTLNNLVGQFKLK